MLTYRVGLLVNTNSGSVVKMTFQEKNGTFSPLFTCSCQNWGSVATSACSVNPVASEDEASTWLGVLSLALRVVFGDVSALCDITL